MARIAAASDRWWAGSAIPVRRSGAFCGATPTCLFRPARSNRWNSARAKPPLMRVNFMGLHGSPGNSAAGLLRTGQRADPRQRHGRCAISSICSITGLISLFYQAWEKFHFEIPYERGELDRFSQLRAGVAGAGYARLAEPAGCGGRFAAVLRRAALHALPVGHGAAAGVMGLFRRSRRNRAVCGRVVSGGRGIAVLPGRERQLLGAVGIRRGGGQ